MFKGNKVKACTNPMEKDTGGMGILVTEGFFYGSVFECDIRGRCGEGPLFVIQNMDGSDLIVPNLHHYAIVPKEYLYKLEDKVREVRE